jgi:hypothetical protein
VISTSRQSCGASFELSPMFPSRAAFPVPRNGGFPESYSQFIHKKLPMDCNLFFQLL